MSSRRLRASFVALTVVNCVFVSLVWMTIFKIKAAKPFIDPEMALPIDQSLPYGYANTSFSKVKNVLRGLTKHSWPSGATCVVVGSSRKLLSQMPSRLIESHDIIVRLNDAPVRDYEHIVGNRTTVRLFYPESALRSVVSHDGEAALQVLVPFKVRDIDWLADFLSGQESSAVGFWKRPVSQSAWGRSLAIDQLRVINPLYVKKALSYIKSRPTTGFVALILAIGVCDKVTAVGFGYPARGEYVHYYNTDRLPEVSVHNSHREGVLIATFEKLGLLTTL